MKQLLFHTLMVCLFLPILWVVAISLNSFGFPLMEKNPDLSVKFFIGLPYCLLVAASLYGCGWVAERLSGFLTRKFGKIGENEAEVDAGYKIFDSALMEKNRSIFMKNVDTWLKDNILAKIIFGLIIGFVLVI
ncbi:MAG: hypothetical protein H0U72_01565 [Nitrosospira sp.]|nr:hypothetical protein [Nitrosospira sp.]